MQRKQIINNYELLSNVLKTNFRFLNEIFQGFPWLNKNAFQYIECYSI